MGDQPGPVGLVGGADPGPIVTVEVLVEEQTVVPGGVGLEPLVAAEDRPRPFSSLRKIAIRQLDRSSAMSWSVSRRPLAVGYSTVKSCPSALS